MRKLILLIMTMVAINATTPTYENVTRLYVATFDRTPDVTGLKYWVNDSGLELEEIARSFFDQPETKAKYYPDGTIYLGSFVDEVYVNLFDRAPDSTGRAYWIDAMYTGRVHYSTFILAVINGAQGNDAIILADKTKYAMDEIRDGLDDGVTSLPVVIQTTDAKIVLTDIMETNGGTMYVESPGDPIHGMVIDVPQDAYDETVEFTVSYSPMVEYKGNTYLNPVTPLITIDNNEKVANEIITVKIPLKMEQDYHYMAFYYNRATGEVEGIPDIAHDETSITIATTHFSDIFVNRAKAMSLLLDDFDTGYQVGKDNWQFKNMKTTLSPNAMCAGMSISSLYYYIERKKRLSEPQLSGRYDIGLTGPDDDSMSIKLAAKAQEYFLLDRQDEYYETFVTNRKKNDVWRFFMFAHGLGMSGKPQFLSLWDNKGGGHAMVVYKRSGNSLYVADPNFPKDTNIIIELEYDQELNGNFKPYRNYTDYMYFGTTAIVDWNRLKDLWQEMDNKTVGQHFPTYKLTMIETDASGKETERSLADDYIMTVETESKEVKLKIESDTHTLRLSVFAPEGYIINNDQSEMVGIKLKKGEDVLGLYVESRVYSFSLQQWIWVWNDYRYIRINSSPAIDTPSWPNYPNPEYCSRTSETRSVRIDTNGDPHDGTYAFCSYFWDGNLNYENLLIDNKQNGFAKYYYVYSGQLQSQTPYTDGLKNGEQKIFDGDGRLTHCRLYEDDIFKGYCM